MEIFVVLSDFTTVRVECDPNDHVQDLINQFGIGPNAAAGLCFENRRLPMNGRLEDCVSHSGATLWLLVRGRGGIGITAAHLNFKAAASQRGKIKKYPPYITLTKQMCILTTDDDESTLRAQLPCKCVYSREGMTMLANEAIADGKSRFFCGGKCGKEIPYHVVRHVACLDKENIQTLETAAGYNYVAGSEEEEISVCPECHAPLFWEREDKHVKCPGCKYEFCWRCRRKWNGRAGGNDCKNSRCQEDGPEIMKLLTCPLKKIYGRDVPMLRACPKCGLIMEHIDACMQMDCPRHSCNHSFCMICLRDARDECPWTPTPTCVLAERQIKLASLPQPIKVNNIPPPKDDSWCTVL